MIRFGFKVVFEICLDTISLALILEFLNLIYFKVPSISELISSATVFTIWKYFET